MKHKAEPTIACVSDPAGERTLVVAAQNGDEQAFETLFKRYRRKTFAARDRYRQAHCGTSPLQRFRFVRKTPC
jgi:hypothetical protein